MTVIEPLFVSVPPVEVTANRPVLAIVKAEPAEIDALVKRRRVAFSVTFPAVVQMGGCRSSVLVAMVSALVVRLISKIALSDEGSSTPVVFAVLPV